MVPALRLLRNLLAFVVASFSMTAPATAWDAHEISHIGNPVAIDEHHHHDDDGVQVSHGQGDDAPAQGDEEDGGHDHMPSLSTALSAILDHGPVAILPTLIGTSPPASHSKVPVELIEPPPARPPRFV